MIAIFILGFSTLVSIYYVKEFSWSQAILMSLDSYIPISGTILLLTFLYPNNNKKIQLFNIGFFYSIIIIISLFSVKEILLPFIKPKPTMEFQKLNTPYAIVLKEFENSVDLPTKTGMILKNNRLCFIFGVVTQQNTNAYLIQNVFFKAKNGLSLFSDYAKVIDNQIVLYKAVIFQQNNNKKILPQNYLLPLPFDMYSFFNIWNTHDPKEIELIPAILNNMFNNIMLNTTVLAFAYYLIGFITLLGICIIATSFASTLTFSYIGMIGNIAVVGVSYPFILLFYEYISLVIKIIINTIL